MNRFVNKRKNASIILRVLLAEKRAHLSSARRTTHSKRSYADDLHSQKRTKKPRKRAKRISISIAQRLLFLSLSSLLSPSLFLSLLFFCLFFFHGVLYSPTSSSSSSSSDYTMQYAFSYAYAQTTSKS